MFKNITKFIIKQMDARRELVPAESSADHERFRPLCLLTKKRKPKRVFHPDPYYEDTPFTLDHVLLPGEDGESIEFIQQSSSQFTFTKASTDQVDGDFSISFQPASAGVQGAVYFYKGFSIKPQKKGISVQSLVELRNQRKINMAHPFIKQLLTTDNNLYVVTEILEASEVAEYKESTKAGGGFKAKFYATISGQGNKEDTQSISIPKGCTLAFRTIQIRIRDGEWELDFFPKHSTPKRWSLRCSPDDSSPVSAQSQEAHVSLEKSGVVVREVEQRCLIFSMLSPDLLHILLNTIKAVMRDKNLLQELRQKMEEVPEQNDGYELKTESPDLQALFSTLQDFPRDHLLFLAEGITYVLDALHELMEDQLLLLLESLDRKIVSQQLKLVVNLLKHDLEQQMQPFHVDAELLSFPHEEEQWLTLALVEQSGVQLQEDGSALPRDQPFEAVAALFVALYTLNLLSGSK